MLDPVGPLPPAVYWRRRAVALVAIVLSVLLVFWVASTIANADSDPSGTAAGTSSSTSTPASASGSAADDEASAPADGAGSNPADPSNADPSNADPSGADPSGADSSGADPSSPAATSPAAPSPQPPGACAVESIQVQVSANNNTFVKGDKPKLVLSVVNVGAVPCYRDLDAAGQELTVWDAAKNRLWSSNDCYPEKSDDTRLLQPGEKVDFSVVWSGKVSEPTCTQPRPLLGPGSYYLLAAQDGIVSALVPFSITEK